MAEKNIKCLECGCELSYIKKFEHLPCNSYCCGHCPNKNDEGGCPKEKEFGGFFS